MAVGVQSRSMRAVDYFVPEALRADPVAGPRVRVLVLTIGVIVPPALILALNHLALGSSLQGAFILGGILVALGLLPLIRRTGRVTVAAHVLLAVMFAVITSAVVLRGGTTAQPAVTLALIPLLATFVVGWRAGVAWASMVVLAVAIMVVLESAGMRFTDQLRPEGRPIIGFVLPLLFTLVLTSAAAMFVRATVVAVDAARTAEQRRQRALEETRRVHSDRMAAVGQLAAGVAHEINNPLAYVVANLSYVEGRIGELPPGMQESMADAAEALREARLGAGRIRRIVGDLKSFARADEEHLRPVLLGRVIDGAAKMARTEIEHRATLEREIDVSLAVEGDELRLTQVFLNLLVNAAQAIPEGRAEQNTIVVSAHRDGSRAIVTVADTGSGIAAEALPKVFDAFYTSKPAGIGTGLGLAVCKSIVEGYGGTVGVESRIGEGTTVTVAFPAIAAAIEPEEHVSSTQMRLRASQRRKVLVVDDDLLVRRSLERTLRAHDVTSVATGREALTHLEGDGTFDVVLCDLMMPNLTGMDVYERCRARDPDLADRFVFISGGAFTDRAREFLERVENPRIDKPFDPARVVEAVVGSRRNERRFA